ncbi:MAG: glycosyltransferase family 39 protein [Ardenticatenaceae bacterium]|nr:glycosyltransferase family 39 protein [Ardenticatenaceae bacterium]
MVPTKNRTAKSAGAFSFGLAALRNPLRISGPASLIWKVRCHPKILLTTILVVAAAAALWLRPAPFHEDEAIYAAWALAVRGDWALSRTPIDKPPLFFYPLAASLALFGPSEAAARVPNLLATIAAAFFVFRLVVARRGRVAATAAALLFLAAPLTQAYAASAFTDPLMLVLALAAAERAQAGRARVSGLLLGLAVLTKPTALFLVPFVLVAGSRLQAVQTRHRGVSPNPRASTLLLALAAVLLVGWAWDAARLVPGWWVLGGHAYGSLGRPEVALGTWARWLLLGLGPLAAAGGWDLGDRHSVPSSAGEVRAWRVESGNQPRISNPHSPLPLSEAVLWGTLVLFLPLHVLLGFQPWDRYLLPLAALLAVGAGWWLSRPARAALVAALLALPLTLWTAAGGTGLGGRDGRWVGIAALGAAVRALPPGTTVLYTDVGRPLAFYARGARATLRWAPDAQALAALAGEAPGPVFIAARASALPSPCRPSPTRAEATETPFVLAPVEAACRAALIP